jgi:hypothetical protein
MGVKNVKVCDLCDAAEGKGEELQKVGIGGKEFEVCGKCEKKFEALADRIHNPKPKKARGEAKK